MDTAEPEALQKRQGGKSRAFRWLRLIAIGVALEILCAGLPVASDWLGVFATSQTGHKLRYRFVQAVFAGFLLIAAMAPLGLIASTVIGLRARRTGNRRLASHFGRLGLVSFGLLVSLGISEIVIAWKVRGLASLVHVSVAREKQEPAKRDPETAPDLRPLQQAPAAKGPQGSIKIAIIGGSSAHGVPFAPRLSLDRILAWQLSLAFPEKTFNAENLALPGLYLTQAIERLTSLKRRPDVLIVYSGQNEFQTRFGWARKAPHYVVESIVSLPTLMERIRSLSGTADFLGKNLDRFAAEFAPRPRKPRDPADSPCCTPTEYESVLASYRRRLEGLLDDCDAAGILTIVVVPPSNDGAFDPNRSILPPNTPLKEQYSFLDRVQEARRHQASDPARAMSEFRALIAEQPGFAETHYRLAQLLESAGSYDEARSEYVRARDLDGLPFRCQTPFLDVCREVGKHHRSIVVDAPWLFERASPHGILNDRLFADAHHPALNAFVIMARDTIRQLKLRRAFGWPETVPAPSFTMADCLRHFKLDQDAWVEVCEKSHIFYSLSALLPRDASWRNSIALKYAQAAHLLRSGKSPDETGIPSLKIREELRADPVPDSDS